MTADRKAIPRAKRDAVLREYNHACAICKREQILRSMPKDKNTRKEANRIGREIVNELEAGNYVEPAP